MYECTTCDKVWQNYSTENLHVCVYIVYVRTSFALYGMRYWLLGNMWSIYIYIFPLQWSTLRLVLRLNILNVFHSYCRYIDQILPQCSLAEMNFFDKRRSGTSFVNLYCRYKFFPHQICKVHNLLCPVEYVLQWLSIYLTIILSFFWRLLSHTREYNNCSFHFINTRCLVCLRCPRFYSSNVICGG